MKKTAKSFRNLLFPIWKGYNYVKAHSLSYPKSGNGFESVSQQKMIQYNKLRYHGAKKLFCYNPFVNLFFNISGNAIACCRSHTNVLGKYPEQSIKEIWFSDKAEQMREHMLHNDLNMGCEYCKLQIETNRFHSLPSMLTDQFSSSKADIYPKVLELELSNTCNLQCVMCSGRVSSAIRKHREKLPPIESPYDDAFVEQLKEFIPHLEKICFYGGEPFLIDIYYKILDLVLEINPKISVYAVTNGTVFNSKIEQLMKSAQFNLLVSIDSLIPERFNKIRVGADLNQVIANFNKFLVLTNGNTSISHTPMKMNWDETPDIINFCNKNNVRINMSYVEKPAKFALWSFTPDKLDEVYELYQNVKWESTPNHYTAKYNIKVFNEWREQVKYFRDRNREILQSFGNIEEQFKDLEPKLSLTVRAFFEHVPKEWISYEQSMNVIDVEILKKPRTPAQLDSIRELIENFTRINMIHTPEGELFLKDIEKFSEYIVSLIREDMFWARYY